MRKLAAAVAVIAVGVALVGFRADRPAQEWQEYPGAVEADPDHYSVEFENDVVRLVRIKYGPGETSTMHHHPANCAIQFTDADVTMELPDGEMVDSPLMARQVACFDAEVHKPTNTGEEALELIVVEFKGREKVSE